MKTCKKYKKKLVLLVYDELLETERLDLQAHLKTCPSCQSELAKLEQLHSLIPNDPLLSTDNKVLELLNSSISLKIRKKSQEKRKTKVFPFTFFKPAPVFQTMFALFLVAIGFLLGHLYTTQNPGQTAMAPNVLETMLSATEQVKGPNGQVSPFLLGVEKIKFDPVDEKIHVFYNTVNDIKLQGDLSNPTIHQILQYAMLEEESPAVRLHAVKAINATIQKTKNMSPELIRSVEQLLLKEENQGVKLAAMTLLKTVEYDPIVKNILVNVLLYDSDLAMRIKAFEILTEKKMDQKETTLFLESARLDTSNVIRFRAEKLLKNMKRPFEDKTPQNLNKEI